ncbi:phage protein NinX family protein [Cronobacter turicensis]
MDYSKLSDQEINGLVMDALSDGNQAHRNGDGSFIELLHQVNSVEFGEYIERDEVYAIYDPCNNPADAWPIIQSNGISIDYDGIDWMAYHCSCASIKYSNPIEEHPGKPLRAAMIVFLMMKESLHA